MKIPRGRVAACRDGVEVGCRMVPLSPSLSGPRRCPAPRTVAYRPRYSTRRIFLAVSASPSCAESEEIDGGPLPRLLRPGRAPGQRDRLPALARRRPPAPPGGADVRHHHAGAAVLGGLAHRGRLHARRDGVHGYLLAARLQYPRGALRALRGQRPACEDGARPQDRCARQRVARPAARTRASPPQLRAPRGAARAARRGPVPQAVDRGAGAGGEPRAESPRDGEHQAGSVVTTVLGVSARAMLKALITGEGAPEQLADLA